MDNARRNLLKFATIGPVVLAGGLATGRSRAAEPMSLAGMVSVLDFIDRAYHPEILDGTSKREFSREIQAAVDSGANVFFPAGGAIRYPIDGQIRISRNYQRLFSDGLARLDFLGSDPTANAMEILSTRRDSGDQEATREAQAIEGFRLTGPPAARYASMVFVEEGTFYSSIERIFTSAGTNRGFAGRLSDAFIRVNGNARSYVNDVLIRDCVLSGLANGDFPPCGIWIEGCIEGRVENTKVFYFNECMRLGSAAGKIRNLQHVVFDQVQLEPTKPTQVVDGQASLRIYSASACTFRDCRLDPGNGAGSANSVAVRISPGGFGAHQIRFADCSFQGFYNARNVFRVDPGAVAQQVAVSGGDIRSFTGLPVLDNSGQADIQFLDNPFFFRRS